MLVAEGMPRPLTLSCSFADEQFTSLKHFVV